MLLILNLRETFLSGPGFEPWFPTMCVDALPPVYVFYLLYSRPLVSCTGGSTSAHNAGNLVSSPSPGENLPTSWLI